MSKDDILGAFRTLARSTGLYGRILDLIDGMDPDDREDYLDSLEEMNFKDIVELVTFMEG